MDAADTIQRRVETYRESCDNCAKSKVRCDKEQPWCQRCVRRGQACSYSPSQRSRKRALSTTQAEGKQRTGIQPCPSISSIASTTDKQDASTFFGHTEGWPACPDVIELLSSGSSSEWLTPDNSNALWLSDMESIAGDSRGSKGLDATDIFTLPKDTGIGTSSAGGMNNSRTPDAGNLALHLMSTAAGQQHCEASVIVALTKLDLPSVSCQGESMTSQNLGTVLAASRSALACASKTVSCTCTPNDNVSLLVAAVLLRILSWYDIVMQNLGGPGNSRDMTVIDGYNSPAASPNDEELDVPSSREQDTEKSRSGSDASRLVVPSMMIGVYELDAETRERIISHIVLSELSKMGRLLSSFSKKFCDPQSITLGDDNKSQLHLALEMFIRNKHSAAVMTVRKRLEGK